VVREFPLSVLSGEIAATGVEAGPLIIDFEPDFEYHRIVLPFIA
jgi:hypothetical protein